MDKTTILALLKSTKKHTVIWENILLGKLLKFCKNSRNLWCSYLGLFHPFFPSSFGMEVLPVWVGHWQLDATVEGSLPDLSGGWCPCLMALFVEVIILAVGKWSRPMALLDWGLFVVGASILQAEAAYIHRIDMLSPKRK